MGRLTPFLEQWSREPKTQNARLIRRGQAVGKLSRAFDAEAIARTELAKTEMRARRLAKRRFLATSSEINRRSK